MAKPMPRLAPEINAVRPLNSPIAATERPRPRIPQSARRQAAEQSVNRSGEATRKRSASRWAEPVSKDVPRDAGQEQTLSSGRWGDGGATVR